MPLILHLLICVHGMLSTSIHAWNLPFMHQKTRTITIMLDPAGDAKHTGRKVDDSFERGITLQCAQQLKTTLEQRSSSLRVVLTRSPGEILEPLHNASFANRLGVDCYISLLFYQETASKPRLYIYQFCDGNDFVVNQKKLTFYPYDKAHRANMPITKKYISLVKQALDHNHQCNVQGVFKIPFKPLIGIQAPAFGIEIGLPSQDAWQTYATLLADSLMPVIEQIANE